jgi:AcrR family transcriptional regulator
MAGRKDGVRDPARTLALLWGGGRSRASRSGRSGLTVPAIVAAAVGLADAEGLEAVSMRRVAEGLGVGAMTLYTHVPGRDELTDLMTDAALADLYDDLDEVARQPGGWRGALRHVAAANWYLYERHPWLLDVQNVRPVLGPHTIRKYEAELRGLEGHGFDDVEMDSVLTLVLTHVSATARARISDERVRIRTGMDDDEWWDISAPLLERLLDPATFPVSSRVGTASSEVYQGAGDPVHALEFGLERILDGVAVLVDRRAPADAGASSGGDVEDRGPAPTSQVTTRHRPWRSETS